MVASVTSYLQFPNVEFSQGAADTGREIPQTGQPLHKKNYWGVQWKKSTSDTCLAKRRLPVSAGAAAARFRCQPEPCGKVFPPAETWDTLAGLGLNTEWRTWAAFQTCMSNAAIYLNSKS